MAAATTTKSVQHITEQFVLDAGVKAIKKYAGVAVDLPSISAGAVGYVDVAVTGVKAGDAVIGIVTADGTELSVTDVVIIGATVNKADNIRVFAHGGLAGGNAASENVDFIVLSRG